MTIVTTTFPNTEDPLDTPWEPRITTLLTDMQSTPGKAFGHAAGIGAYDDSAALLSGFAADTEIDCGVFFDPTLDTDATHECELLTRSTQTSSVAQQVESLFAFFGSVQGVEWINNSGQDFDFLTSIFGAGSIGGNFTTGDRIRTRHVGTRIQLSAFDSSDAETILAVFQSDTPTTGQPGIGAFTRVADGGDATKFCFTDAKVTDEFQTEQLGADNFARGNSDPVDGSWSTPTGLATMELISNNVRASTPGGDAAMKFTGMPTDPLPLDQFVEIEVAVVGDGDGGFMLECQDNGDMIIGTNYNLNDLFIFSRIGGSFTQLGQVTGVYTVGMKLLAWRHGSYVILFVDSGSGYSEVLRIEEKTLVGGEPGIFGYGTVEFTNFKAGKIVANYGDTADVTGTVDVTLAAITGIATGKATNPATVVGTFPVITGTATGKATNPATVVATFAPAEASATGKATNPATVDGTFPAITATATGKATNPATVVGTFAPIEATASGKATNPAVVLGTFAVIEGSATGKATNPATVVGTFVPAEASATGKATNPATVVGTFPAIEASISGNVNPPVSGTVDGTFPAITGVASGSVGDIVSGIVSGVFPAITGEAFGDVQLPSASGVVLGTFAAATVQAIANFTAGGVFGTVDGTFAPITAMAFELPPAQATGVVRLSAARRNRRLTAIER